MTKDVDFAALRITLSDRYTLLRPLATGGMAEIFLARQKALAGFDKHVAVKLLRDRYRGDKRVVEMFMNEARVGAVLSHPNIVHVYDVAEHDRQPFIVMEHIQGEELSQLCRRGLELAHFLPLEHAVDLVRQAAEALGYVHARRDDSGRPLEIVHRDISPSNLLITHDGVLKIIDFGIARASFGDEATEADKLVPGKYNYMSPEQVRGERVDQRSDIFSLGIVLYEITVGKRLFKGRPEEVMQKVTRGRIKPPTFIRRQFPPALERIVMRALEAHRDDRYHTAYELAADLEEFLRESGLKSGPVRIAQYLDELRTAEGGERRPELIIAGEAWLDDDGEEALDFDRGFAPSKPSTGPTSLAKARDLEASPKAAAEEKPASGPVPLVPAPVVESVPVLALPAAPVVQTILPAPVATPVIIDEEPSTGVALAKPPLPTETVPLRTVPRSGMIGDDGEELTNVHGDKLVTAQAEPPIDPDIGEDIPTDASLVLPFLDSASDEEQTGAPMTTPIVLTEPTGRVPLTSATNKVPLAAPASVASGTGKVPLVRETSAAIQVPLRAEPTGKVALAPAPAPAPAPAVPAPSLLVPSARAERALEAARLAAIDPALAVDTPLPPVPDPLTFEETSRHPLADPLLDGFVAAHDLRMLKADASEAKEESVADSMSVTLGAQPVSTRPATARVNRKKHAKKRVYRPRNLANLEITPDPVAASAVFGAGIVQRKRKDVPWPLIIGVGLALLLIVLLMTR